MATTYDFVTENGIRYRRMLVDGVEKGRVAWDAPVFSLSLDKESGTADGVDLVTLTVTAEEPDDSLTGSTEVLIGGLSEQSVTITAGSGQLQFNSTVAMEVEVRTRTDSVLVRFA